MSCFQISIVRLTAPSLQQITGQQKATGCGHLCGCCRARRGAAGTADPRTAGAAVQLVTEQSELLFEMRAVVFFSVASAGSSMEVRSAVMQERADTREQPQCIAQPSSDPFPLPKNNNNTQITPFRLHHVVLQIADHSLRVGGAGLDQVLDMCTSDGAGVQGVLILEACGHWDSLGLFLVTSVHHSNTCHLWWWWCVCVCACVFVCVICVSIAECARAQEL